MFSDYNGKIIEFRKKSKNSNLIDEILQTSLDETEFYDEEVQVIEKSEQMTQTDYKEILSYENMKINEKNLEQFLRKVK